MFSYQHSFREDKDDILRELRGTFAEDLYGRALAAILLMLDASTRVPLSPSVNCDFTQAHYLARAFQWTQSKGRSLLWDIKAAGQHETGLNTAARILAKFQCLQDQANRLLSSYKTSESSSSFFRVYDDTAVRQYCHSQSLS